MTVGSGLVGGAVNTAPGGSSGAFDADVTILGIAISNFDAQIGVARTSVVSEFDAKVCVEIEASQVAPSATILTPTAVNTSGIPPFTTTFSGTGTASGVKTITNYTWFFHNLNTTVSGGPSVEYTFDTSGSLLVTLRVMDSDGFVGFDSRRILTHSGVVLELPELQISGVPQQGQVSIKVNFGASGGAIGGTTILGYGWNFGHNRTSRRQNPSGIFYYTPGNFTTVCSMADSRGVVIADSLQVGVNN